MFAAGRSDEYPVLTPSVLSRPSHEPAARQPSFSGLISALLVSIAAGGCATGPQEKTVVEETFFIETVGDTPRQTIGAVTIEALGEAQNIVQPMEVQACDGPRLKFRRVERKTEEGKKYFKRHPVHETVDPFHGIYLRKLRLRNDTSHVLRLNRIDAVLLDAAGNDNELMTKAGLRHHLRASRPCQSTEALVQSLRVVKLLGADIRIRPGRATELLAAFSGVDPRIIGDWTLELNGVPVATDPAGRTLRFRIVRVSSVVAGLSDHHPAPQRKVVRSLEGGLPNDGRDKAGIVIARGECTQRSENTHRLLEAIV